MTTTRFPSAAGRPAAAQAEDASVNDITTAWSVSEDLAATAEVRTRQSGIAAGLPVVAEVFAQVDPETKIEASVTHGARLTEGDVLMRLSGPARSLITGERMALKFWQRLCGIATVTVRYVQAVAATTGSTSQRWPCSRRTTSPRRAAGGGSAAIEAVRRGMARTGQTVEVDVEVQTVAEAAEALDAGARWIMLDNMPLADIGRVVKIRAGRADASRILLEASGSVRLDSVRAIAETGVSAPALDLTMLLTTGTVPCPR